MPSSSSATEGRQWVESFARGLAVIRAFDAEHRSMTLSEVAARADISRAATRRFLQTLETLGYVRVEGRAFVLTPRVLELGYAYLSASSLAEFVQPHLERLTRELDESVSAAVLDGEDIVYIARVATRRIMSVGITIGTRFPADRTSMGHILRGDEAQWALADQELEPGLRAIAAPLHDKDGTVIAAINVSTSTSRVDLDDLTTRHLSALLATAEAIDVDLAAARHAGDVG